MGWLLGRGIGDGRCGVGPGGHGLALLARALAGDRASPRGGGPARRPADGGPRGGMAERGDPLRGEERGGGGRAGHPLVPGARLSRAGGDRRRRPLDRRHRGDPRRDRRGGGPAPGRPRPRAAGGLAGQDPCAAIGLRGDVGDVAAVQRRRRDPRAGGVAAGRRVGRARGDRPRGGHVRRRDRGRRGADLPRLLRPDVRRLCPEVAGRRAREPDSCGCRGLQPGPRRGLPCHRGVPPRGALGRRRHEARPGAEGRGVCHAAGRRPGRGLGPLAGRAGAG